MVGSRRGTRPFLLTGRGLEARLGPAPSVPSRTWPVRGRPSDGRFRCGSTPRYGSSMTTSAAATPAAETLYTKDARKLVWITLLCLFLQVPAQNWSSAPLLPGSTEEHPNGFVQFEARPWIGWALLTIGFAVAGFVIGVARHGAARWDEDRVLALGLAGVIGVTVLVWLVFIVQWQWVYWAAAHGNVHPFTIGDVGWSIERTGAAP